MRIRQLFDRLVIRLVAVAVVAGLAAAVAGEVLVAGLARSTLREEIAEGHLAAAQDLAVRFDTRVDSIAASLRLAATHPAIQAMERSSETDLRAFLATSVTLEELILFDRSGTPVAAAADRFLADLDDYPRRPVLAASGQDPVVNVIDAFPPVLEIATPVEFPPGTVAGMLVARGPLELVASHIQQRDASRTAEHFLADSEGQILVHPARDLVAERQRFSFPSFFGGAAAHGIFEEGGTQWLVAVAPTELFEGAVVVRQEEAAALGPVVDQLRQLSLIVVAVIGATVIAISLAGRQLLHPLRLLSDAVGDFSRGDYGRRVHAGRGEIGVVARQFNQMAERLDRRRAEVSEMHSLSLLITSRADRQAVADDIVKGIRRLLAAEGAVFLAPDEQGDLTPLAFIGEGSTRSTVTSISAKALEAGDMRLEVDDGGAALIALPVEGVDAEASGVLVVIRDRGEPEGEELRLAETFASFAGVALENVRRLELEQLLVYELQQSLDQRRELLSNITHDLRAPVVAMLDLSSRLREEGPRLEPAEAQALLADLESEALALDSLVGTLLEFTMAERGPHRVTMAPIRLHTSVNGAIDLLSPLLGDRPVRVEVPDTEVMGDTILMKRVLVHLLSNAARFSPPGTPIEVRARREGDAVTMEVADHGFGLTPEEASMAFEPFWRRIPTGEQPAPGLGLGLSLTADYVRAMGGRLEVDSRPGQGSIFYVTLAAAEVDGRALTDDPAS